jgi:hypothetical protein
MRNRPILILVSSLCTTAKKVIIDEVEKMPVWKGNQKA